MLIIGFLRYIRGYVRFTAEAGSAERLLNLCAHNRVPTWRCYRQGERMTGCTTVEGYHAMRTLAKKAGVRLRVAERHGVPFTAHRYRKRIGFIIGALLFAALLILSQQFIWTIRVEGCQRVDPQILENALEELGVRRGTLKSGVNTWAIQREITIKVNELSWAALNIQGTTATLVIIERTPPPPKIDTNVPANVVAAKDGLITRMEVTDGITVRKKGDTVVAGELLVSGVHEDRWGMTHLLRANARVTASVPETLEVRIPLRQETARLTGEIVRRRYLEVFGTKLPLFLYTGLEGDYKVERMTEPLELFGISLPFTVTKETYVFFERDTAQISEETALRAAKKQLESRERSAWGSAVLSSQHQADVENGELVLRGSYIVEENIAKQVEIPLFDRSQKEKAAREGGY